MYFSNCHRKYSIIFEQKLILYSRIFNLTYLKCFNSILAGFTFMFLHNFLASLKKEKNTIKHYSIEIFLFSYALYMKLHLDSKPREVTPIITHPQSTTTSEALPFISWETSLKVCLYEDKALPTIQTSNITPTKRQKCLN